MAETLNDCNEYMKTPNFWSLEEPGVLSLEDYIEQNLAKCRSKASEEKKKRIPKDGEKPEVGLNQNSPITDGKENVTLEHVALNKETDGVFDCGDLQPPGIGSTPVERRPLQGDNLSNAPRKPFSHLPRIYQRPKTLFEKKSANNVTSTANWEKCFHLGNEKYVSVTQFNGHKAIHVRQFYMDKNNIHRPTKKGLTLTPSEWNNLTVLVKDVNKELMSLMSTL